MGYYSETQPRILDATAGNRSMWFDAHQPGVIYCDIRPEVSPDIICDIKCLPFKDHCFNLIVFDPPHCHTGTGVFASRYGSFGIPDIRLLLNQVFAEFHRVLNPAGYLIFKWNSHDIKISDALKYAIHHFEPLFGQRTAIRTKHTSMTYWVCLRPYQADATGRTAIKTDLWARRNSSPVELPSW